MRTAITATGNKSDSLIDRKFGRCAFFVIYDSETRSVEYIPNPFADAEESAGAHAVRLLEDREVKRIIAGDFGLKIKPLLDSLKIQMIVIKDPARKISEIIELLERKK
ncbi:MAG: NifB/NifX family molybdenum-iron cluster-binding protein [Bacteroidales bacterium]